MGRFEPDFQEFEGLDPGFLKIWQDLARFGKIWPEFAVFGLKVTVFVRAVGPSDPSDP